MVVGMDLDVMKYDGSVWMLSGIITDSGARLFGADVVPGTLVELEMVPATRELDVDFGIECGAETEKGPETGSVIAREIGWG